MNITSINFANNDFKRQQWWNTKTAKLFGGIDKVISYGPEDIDQDFLKQNKRLFEYSKGFGNYFWKPFLINKTLKILKDGDYLVYADSGTIFIKNIKSLITYMEANEADVMCFTLPLIEKQWTKRDAFILMECDSSFYTDSVQITGNFIILKKSKSSENFIAQYLTYCSDYRIISDAENVMGSSNYPEFIAHRHDQSVLSLLCKKNNILLEGDLSDYGVFPKMYLHTEQYLFDEKALDQRVKKFKGTILANRKEHPVIYATKYFIRKNLIKFGIKV